MCSVANGRIKEVVEAGAPVGVEWNQGILYHTAYAVLKGANNVEDTMKPCSPCSSPPRSRSF